ncbi:MAG: hypothetical protein ABIJ96_09675 [Elusimicrobiota bacterium]
MKVLERSEARLVIGERGLDTRHWGYLVIVLGGAGLCVMLTDDKPLILPALLLSGFFFLFGLFAAIFMRKQLTHILDKGTNTLTVEYPAQMNTKLEIERVPLSSIVAVCTQKKVFMRTSGSPGPSHRLASTGHGFFYQLEDGKEIESGIYTSVQEEIDAVVDALHDFLDFGR